MGIVQTLIGIASLGILLFCMLLVIILPVIIMDTLALMSGLIKLAFFGSGAAVSGFFLYGLYGRSKATPTDDQLFSFEDRLQN